MNTDAYEMDAGCYASSRYDMQQTKPNIRCFTMITRANRRSKYNSNAKYKEPDDTRKDLIETIIDNNF